MAVAVAVIVIGPAGALVALSATTPAIAAPPPPPTISGVGYGAFDPLASAPISPDTFDVSTLITGGAANVNPSSLTLVTAPPVADGTATVSGSATNDLVTLSQAVGAPASQFSLTYGICAVGYSYTTGSPECSTGQITYLPTADTLMGWVYSTFNADIYEGIGIGTTSLVSGAESSSVKQGGNFSEVLAPEGSSVPATDDGITVNYSTGFDAMVPIPAGSQFVSATLEGGDATTAGQAFAVQCTSASHPAPCSGTTPGTGNYVNNTYPYVEVGLPSSLQIKGGSNVTVPTAVVTFKAIGPPAEIPGFLQNFYLDEYQVLTNVAAIGNVAFDGWQTTCNGAGWPPSTSNCSGTPPVATVAQSTVIGSIAIVLGIIGIPAPPPHCFGIPPHEHCYF